MVKIYNFYLIDPAFYGGFNVEVPCFSPAEALDFIIMNRRRGFIASLLGIRFIAEEVYNEEGFLL